MNNISIFEKCSGCGACAQACAKDAIRMAGEGFFYRPEVDEGKCIGCGLCVQVCPVNTPMRQGAILSAWAGVHKDDVVVKNSSSGGAFSALAQMVLDMGGVVFGACFREDCRKVVITGTNVTPLAQLRKSKYVESTTADSYREVKKLLQAGTPVLYCAAPCQIAGLKRCLGREYENLVTCDFTCGGMPSHKLYQDYLQELEQHYGAMVEYVDFRPKTLGWENHAIRIRFSDGQIYHSPAMLDPYFSAFVYGHYSVRDLCLECPFSDNHYSDVILADFWRHREFPGWEKPGKGISLILAATPRGEALLQKASRDLELGQVDLDKGCYNIKKTSGTENHRQQREAFLRDCVDGIRAAAKKYSMPSGAKALKIRVKSLLRYVLRGVK